MASSPWVKKMEPDKIWLCKSVSKLKEIGNQGEEKMNEMNTLLIYKGMFDRMGFPI